MRKNGFEKKISQFIEEDELIEQAIAVLMEKLGPVETKRILTIATNNRRVKK